MDAIPSKVILCLLKNDCNENPNLDYITNSIFIGHINILKNNIPNKYIRNEVNYVTYPWRTVDKLFVNKGSFI